MEGFSVETSVSNNKILGFHMFHAKLEDEVSLAVSLGNLEMIILINNESDSSEKGIKIKPTEGKDTLLLTLVNVDANENTSATFAPAPFAENKDDGTLCLLQITMTRPNPDYDYWLYAITFCEKDMKDEKLPAAE
jgi:hypothetical protein